MKTREMFRLFFIFSFLRGFIFWYVIEKVFLRDAGLTDQQILLMACMRGATSLLLEVPTGALGDRWGYKKTVSLSLVLLAWSGVQYLVADHFVNFLLATAVWTASFALSSGTLQAYLHGLVVPREGEARYRHYAGRSKAINVIGVMVGSVVGSLLASVLPLWSVFALSTLPALGALAVLLRLPTIRAKPLTDIGGEVRGLLSHARASLTYILFTPQVRRVLLTYIIISIPMLTFLELSQLQYLAVGLLLVLFGPVDFVRFGASMLGNLLGGSKGGALLGTRRGRTVSLAVLAGLLWLLYVWQSPWSVLLVCAATFVVMALEVNLDAELQRKLPNALRAASTSSVSFVCNVIWCALMLATAFSGAANMMHALIGIMAVLVSVGGAGIVALKERRKVYA